MKKFMFKKKEKHSPTLLTLNSWILLPPKKGTNDFTKFFIHFVANIDFTFFFFALVSLHGLRHWYNTVRKLLNFTVNQILREIKIGEFRVSKSANFDTFRASGFRFFMNFCIFWRLYVFEQIKTKFRGLKRAKNALPNSPISFHVKSERQKHPEISTLCTMGK